MILFLQIMISTSKYNDSLQTPPSSPKEYMIDYENPSSNFFEFFNTIDENIKYPLKKIDDNIIIAQSTTLNQLSTEQTKTRNLKRSIEDEKEKIHIENNQEQKKIKEEKILCHVCFTTFKNTVCNVCKKKFQTDKGLFHNSIDLSLDLSENNIEKNPNYTLDIYENSQNLQIFNLFCQIENMMLNITLFSSSIESNDQNQSKSTIIMYETGSLNPDKSLSIEKSIPKSKIKKNIQKTSENDLRTKSDRYKNDIENDKSIANLKLVQMSYDFSYDESNLQGKIDFNSPLLKNKNNLFDHKNFHFLVLMIINGNLYNVLDNDTSNLINLMYKKYATALFFQEKMPKLCSKFIQTFLKPVVCMEKDFTALNMDNLLQDIIVIENKLIKYNERVFNVDLWITLKIINTKIPKIKNFELLLQKILHKTTNKKLLAKYLHQHISKNIDFCNKFYCSDLEKYLMIQYPDKYQNLIKNINSIKYAENNIDKRLKKISFDQKNIQDGKFFQFASTEMYKYINLLKKYPIKYKVLFLIPSTDFNDFLTEEMFKKNQIFVDAIDFNIESIKIFNIMKKCIFQYIKSQISAILVDISYICEDYITSLKVPFYYTDTKFLLICKIYGSSRIIIFDDLFLLLQEYIKKTNLLQSYIHFIEWIIADMELFE